MKNTVAIIYSPGAYGTYLEWCLTALCSTEPLVAPFTDKGNSHNFAGNFLPGITAWREYVNSNHDLALVRLHPKIQQSDDFYHNVLEVTEQSRKSLLLYPGPKTKILSCNNQYYKIVNNWIGHELSKTNLDLLYSNWPVPPDTPVDKIDPWIMREFLSYYMVPTWQSLQCWNFVDRWHHKKSKTILIEDLLWNFESTLASVVDFCELPIQRPISDLTQTHKLNLSLQRYIDQDQKVNDIVHSLGTDSDLSWHGLSLVSEAWLQHELRNLNWEIHCHGLDNLPTSTVQLKKLLYTK